MKYFRSIIALTLILITLLSSCSPSGNGDVTSDSGNADDVTTTLADEGTTSGATEEEEKPEENVVIKLPYPYIDVDFDDNGRIFDRMGNADCTVSDQKKGSVVTTAVKFDGKSYTVPHYEVRASGGTALLRYTSLASYEELFDLLDGGFTMEAFLVNHTKLQSDSAEHCMVSSCQTGGYNFTTHQGLYKGSIYTNGAYRNPILNSEYNTEELTHLLFIYYPETATAVLYVNGIEVSSVSAPGEMKLAGDGLWDTVVIGGDIGTKGTTTHCDSFELTDFKLYSSSVIPSQARAMFELSRAELTGAELDYTVEYTDEVLTESYDSIFKSITDSFATSIYEYETSIQSAPTVLQYLTEDMVGIDVASREKRPATLIYNVKYEGGELYGADISGRELGLLDRLVKKLEKKIIPAFIIDKSTATLTRDFINNNRIGDCFVICSDEKLLREVCESTTSARPVLDCRAIQRIDPDDVYVRASFCGSKVILANMRSLDADNILALRARSIAIFAEPDGDTVTSIHNTVFANVAGVVTYNYESVIEYYESFDDSAKALSAPPLIVAHRGDVENHPHNVMSSFISAAKSGANITELDVWLTADGHLVINHDEKTTGFNTQLICTESTREELKALKSTSPLAAEGDEIAFYDEVLEYFSKNYTDMVFLVEVKDKRNVVVDKIMELTRQYKMEGRIIIICMTHSIVRYAADTYGQGIQMNRSYMLDVNKVASSVAPACLECADLKTSFFTRWQESNQQFSDLLRHRGIKYSPWTTNSAADTDKHYLAGYPEFTTNYPHVSDKYVRRIELTVDADGTLHATRVNYDGTTEDVTDDIELAFLDGDLKFKDGKISGQGSLAVKLKITLPLYTEQSYYIYSNAVDVK